MCFFIFFYICQKCSWALWLWSNGHASSVSLSEPGRSAGPSDEFRDTDYSPPSALSAPLALPSPPPTYSRNTRACLLSPFACLLSPAPIIRHYPHFLVFAMMCDINKTLKEGAARRRKWSKPFLRNWRRNISMAGLTSQKNLIISVIYIWISVLIIYISQSRKDSLSV